MPFCALTEAVICSARFSIASANRAMMALRSAGEVARQPGRALRAAATARSTSASVPSGTSPITAPSLAPITGTRRSEAGAAHSPPM
jgi:hypothetical protein